MENQNQSYFYNEVGEASFVFLANLHNFNLDSRRYMANAIYNSVYLPLERSEGDLANLNPAARRQLLNLSILEILSKVFMAVEDLGKVLILGNKPLREAPNVILGAGENDSLSTIKKNAQKSGSKLFSIVPFVNPKLYGLAGHESKALIKYYLQAAGAIKAFLLFLEEFINRHKWAYDKYKHGIPIILFSGEASLAQGIDGTMPIFVNTTDPAKTEFILTGHCVAEKLVGLIGSVVDFTKMLVARRLQIAEFGGTPPPFLCTIEPAANGTFNFRPWQFGEIDKETEPLLSSIFSRVLRQLNYVPIKATIKVNANAEKIDKWIEFYTRDWRVV